MSKIRLVFVGAVRFSKVMLEALVEAVSSDLCATFEIVGCLGLAEALSAGVCDYADLRPVARKCGIDWCDFEDINNQWVRETLECWKPTYTLVFGLSQILKPATLQLCGTAIGTHPTLLPQGKGHAGIPWSIILGWKRSGLTFFEMDEGVDTGQIIRQTIWAILPEDTATSLYSTMCAGAIYHIPRLLGDIGLHHQSGTWREWDFPRPPASTLPRRTPDDACIDWAQDVEVIMRQVRACQEPYPVAFTDVGGRRVLVKTLVLEEAE